MKARRLRRARHKEPTLNVAWIVTFSDLVTLLIGFFVLRLSMSSLGGATTRAGYGAFRDSIDFVTAQQEETPSPEQPIQAAGSGPRTLSATLAEALQKLPLPPSGEPSTVRFADDVTVARDDRGMIVSLGGTTFGSGSDELSFAAQVNVETIARVIREQLARGEKLEIRVEGHTDSTPVNTPRFPSNWELSSARATRIAQQLISYGIDPEILSAVGYADTKPMKNVLGGAEENRRVEILISPREIVSNG